MNNVRNNANPINTWFGGAVCVPIAFLTKCNTMIILVNEVIMMRIDGASDITVSTNKILIFPETSPFSLFQVTCSPFVLSVVASWACFCVLSSNCPT